MTTISTITGTQPLKTGGHKREGAAVSSSDHRDSVEISDTTSLLTEAEEIATSASDIDEATVTSVREAIAKGEFDIDYERLAQKMLDFELTLFDN